MFARHRRRAFLHCQSKPETSIFSAFSQPTHISLFQFLESKVNVKMESYLFYVCIALPYQIKLLNVGIIYNSIANQCLAIEGTK